MWSESDFRTKARRYFAKAETDDDQLATFLWCALGVEFLLRAPLAKANPVLLADPNSGEGYSVLHAAGFTPTKNGRAQSVGVGTVLERLVAVVPGFTVEDRESARFIVNLRNSELHNSESPIDRLPASEWVPKFLRVVERVASFFAEDVTDYLSDDFIKYASGLVDAEDKKIKAEVEQRINRARHLYEGLTDSEKANRRRAFFLPPAGSQLTASRYTCRACGEPAVMLGEAIRAGRVILDDDAVIRNYRVVAQEFDCTVCLLALHGAVEIGSAGMDQSWVIEEQETLEDRYTGYDDEPDYGND